MAANDPYVWSETNIELALRNTIGDPSGAATERWTQAECGHYLNRALLVVARDAEDIMETEWTVNLADGVYLYAMPVNFDRDKLVELDASGATGVGDKSDMRPLTYLNQKQFQEWFGDDPTETGEPTHYTFWRRLGATSEAIIPTDLQVYPAAATAWVDFQLYVKGYKRPEALVLGSGTDDVCELDAPYVEAAVMYAAFLMMRDDQDHTAAEALKRDYKDQMRSILDHKSRKSRSRTPTLKPRDSILRDWRYSTNRFNRRIP